MNTATLRRAPAARPAFVVTLWLIAGAILTLVVFAFRDTSARRQADAQVAQAARAESDAKLAHAIEREWEQLVAEKKVRVGMSAALAERSWGKPLAVNRTTSGSGVQEQWVYGSSYLYFSNGELTSIQQTESR